MECTRPQRNCIELFRIILRIALKLKAATTENLVEPPAFYDV